jgi:hypothetical protein
MSVQLDNVYPNIESDRGEIDCIQGCQEDIKRLVLLLTRLTKLLLEENIDPKGYIQISQKYNHKLENNLEMRELYLKRIQKESQVNDEEMETVLQNKELLEVRKKIGDISEEEYEIKLAAIHWDINNINEKQDHQKKNLKLLQGLRKQISSEELETIITISKNIETIIKNMDLDPEVCVNVTQNMEIITKIIL